MRELIPLAIWLGVSTIFLFDSLIILSVFGPFTRPSVRQGWLAAPLLFTVLTLLVTPLALLVPVILMIGLIWHLWGHLLGSRRVKSGLIADPALARRVAALAKRWGTRPPDRVLLDPLDRISPGAMGLLNQAVILPGVALSLPEAGFEAVIAHELAHVANRDPLKLWLAGLARLLLGWHPVTRKLTAMIALEVEMEADRQAAAWLGDADSYALTLGRWGLRQAALHTAPFSVALTGHSSQLMLRLRSLLNPGGISPHLDPPAWLPGSGSLRRNRALGNPPRKPPTEGYARGFHLAVSFGYLAAYLVLIRLV